ncbi:NAD-glutamate dehydrogenase [Haloechinothrix sp. YIM 98757]|uniref:NAD-glutamate dehydrogenase n=1 Tax=Haloechinothrix aidingensis TaxID=2752311 RepID=A0A838AAZ6_9PSEU|nr:NAD-glutamate dehydrogenase [Haloechinothrix aidingensis]MBA0126420.1 NAD-glutamate dehydrogenase [Haloechinothrix aidingensis]
MSTAGVSDRSRSTGDGATREVNPERQRDDLIEAAAGLAPDIADLLRLYYRHVPAEDIGGDEPADLVGAVRAHLRLADQRVQGRPVIQILNPDPDESDWSSEATVVQIVTDDMPYLVDSVAAELARTGVEVQRIVHPIVVVSRDVTGTLTEVLPRADADAPPEGTQAESWMCIELDRIGDVSRASELEGRLDSVINDVREVVEDTERMAETAHGLAQELETSPPPLPEAEVSDGSELLRWLVDGHFTFLGYRRYEVVADPGSTRGEPALRAVLASGLGVLRQDSIAARSLTAGPDMAETALAPTLLVLTSASAPSTVHRPVHPYYIGVKTFDSDGNVNGEHRFLGMFTTSALHADVLDIPVIARMVREVIHRAGFPLESHSGQRMLEVLQEWPRAELFSTDIDSLYTMATGAITLADRRRLRLFLRKDPYGRFYSCLVFVPRDRYSTRSRQAMQDVLRRELGGTKVEFATRLGEAMLAQVHFTVYTDSAGDVEPDSVRIQEQLNEAVRSWEDRLVEAILQERRDQGYHGQPHGEETASELGQRFAARFPEAYKEDFDAADGLADLRTLESLSAEHDVTMCFYVPHGAARGESRFKIYLLDEGVTLSSLLPMLQRMGVEVVDQRPYEIHGDEGSRFWIYDFGLRIDRDVFDAVLAEPGLGGLRERFQDAFAAMWHGRSEVDGFNGLVLRSGLTWRQVAVLRAYSRYLRQAGTPYSQAYIEDALLANSAIATELVNLFEAKFALGVDDERRTVTVEARRAEIAGRIDAVSSLDEDRILRRLLTVITATLRTNYFVTETDGSPRSYVSFKLDPQTIPDLPEPRPRFEIYVYSPRVEGVHLRFGPVARGGLRWSDRREDFRTEVLGLAKAQAVKNAVIVPVGAKGGFIVKRPPASSGDRASDREAYQAEGVACYRMFISGLLDLTDNLEEGRTVPPSGVVRYDGDDNYLVVAADKGTATFSDIANEVSAEYGFWLGDAFASGGSAGYDHKAMGITAKGAWESVKRHFRELGVNTQSDDFTVVGIGDMGGDVFGNGMLLSEHIRLVAAFNHMHVFVDPDPDPATSFAERRRLFDTPRSTWDDYDRSLISEGGGVFSRSAKSIEVTPQMRAALGLDDDVRRLAPTELIRAVLLAPVDLLWNGGIGTYVKSSHESHADADDKTNDAVRVDGGELRVRVVGEGGNLGLTQRGRIEFARAGGKINTDAVDNSGGVDCSDHEVNFKILLERLMESGQLARADRDALLESMTDDVTDLVLANNYRQNKVLGISRQHAAPMVSVHQRQVSYLESHAGLDRELEALPSNEEFKELDKAGWGLTSPELASLLAHVKLNLEDELLASELPDQEVFARRLPGYFPEELRARFGDAIYTHPLDRDIVTTLIVNEVVDGAGLSYAFRLNEETHASATDAVRTFAVVTAVYELPQLWQRIDELNNVVACDVTDRLVLETRRLLDRASRWWLTNRPQPLAVGSEINRFAGTVARLAPKVPGFLRGSHAESLRTEREQLDEWGVPGDVADRVSLLLHAYGLLDITEVAELAEQDIDISGGQGPEETAELYYALSHHLNVDSLLTSVSQLERGNRWHALARLALRDDIYFSLRAITLDALRSSNPGDPVDDKIEQWETVNASRLSRARVALDEINRSGRLDLATLSVAARQMRSMAG